MFASLSSSAPSRAARLSFASFTSAGGAQVPGTPSEHQLSLQRLLISLPVLGPVARTAYAAQQAHLEGRSPSSQQPTAPGKSATQPAALSPEQKAAVKAKALAKAVSVKNLKPEDKPLWDLFNEFDANHDGIIDVEELRSALVNLGLPTTDTYLMATLHQFDEHGHQGIAWDEFKSYVKRRAAHFDAAFREFDTDGNGEISASELGRVLARTGMPATGKDLRRLMDIMDKDHDNTISYDEFRRFAIFLPGWQVKSSLGDARIYAGWLRSTAVQASAMEGMQQRQQLAASLNDPLRHFVVFDILLRGSLAASLVLVTVLALNA